MKGSAWRSYVRGEFEEEEISTPHLFDPLQDDEIALHIYHIEKLRGNIPNFTRVAFKALNKVVID